MHIRMLAIMSFRAPLGQTSGLQEYLLVTTYASSEIKKKSYDVICLKTKSVAIS